jgi:carboxylesterase
VTLRLHSALPLAILARLGVTVPDVYLLKPRPGDLADPTLEGTLVTYDRHPLRASLEVYLAGPRVRRGAGVIVCPTLVMHGRLDQVCAWTNALWVADHLGTRDVSVRLFEKSGHVLACDVERDDVAGEAVTFLSRLR